MAHWKRYLAVAAIILVMALAASRIIPKMLGFPDEVLQLAGLAAQDCGRKSSETLLFESYPLANEACAAHAYQVGRAFFMNSCYVRTDSAACHWIIGTAQHQVYFIKYSWSTWGPAQPTFGPATLCPDPIVVKVSNQDTLQCQSMPFTDVERFFMGLP